jgi:hypothetical protein
LARQNNVDPTLVRRELPKTAAKLKLSPTATTYQKASAAYVTKDYAEAERLAMVASHEAQRSLPPRTEEAIRALKLAGSAADALHNLGNAEEHYRAAEKLTDRARNPMQWADVQRFIGFVLD